MAAALLAAACAPTPWIAVDGDRFERAGERFVVQGFNYDHDRDGRLLEDYWVAEWPAVVEDFAEMKALGANVVRVHLQLGRFLRGPAEPDPAALDKLAELLLLAERTGLYVDVTGLGCYHRADVPAWYDALPEAERWQAQACFWSAVAAVCAPSPAVFCYDLMNEPILPGAEPETDWLAGEFAGKHFVQRIALALGGRTREQVARDWVRTLVAAIREHDRRHPITVGVIPWVLTFPGARPLFYSPAVAEHLDFVSVHVYPEKGEVDAAVAAVATFAIGKPIVVEETFPLRCSVDELFTFLDRADVDGFLGFYWGATVDELDRAGGIAEAITAAWLRGFVQHVRGG
jgi:hypothetical protein